MTMRPRSIQGIIGLGIVAVLLTLMGCASIPEECGRNIVEVTHMEFHGPSNITPTPAYDSAVYEVTITVKKNDENDSALACYAVRDEDLFIDDVLNANAMLFRSGENTRTLEGFILYAKNDNEICGQELPATRAGCSGESNPRVYIQPIGSPGPPSLGATIRVGPPLPPPGPCPSGQKCCGSVRAGKCIGECAPEMAPCP